MEYNNKVKDHFLHPHNLGKLKKYNYEAEAANPTCGDALKLFFDVENGKIKKVGMEVLGCGAAIASSSVASELLINKDIDKAKNLKNQEIVEILGGLPEEKIKCSLLVEQALQNIKKI